MQSGDIEENIKENLRLNSLNDCTFIGSDWNLMPEDLLMTEYDVILAADCLFDKKGMRPPMCDWDKYLGHSPIHFLSYCTKDQIRLLSLLMKTAGKVVKNN